jgi:hypothetical protein
MTISKEDLEILREENEKIERAMCEIDYILRNSDKHLYERWKAGGKQVTEEFVSSYPSLQKVIEELEEELEE